jgi:hypothetical protein
MEVRTTRNASVNMTENGWKLEIQKVKYSGYQDAQLDDYGLLPRRQFPHQSLSLTLHARSSSISATGTWGFGLWNDPFGLSLGFGGKPFRLPALPNAVWFFYASQANYLSFTDGKPAQGFLAQTFRSPRFHPLLLLAGLVFPFSGKTTRTLFSKVVEEDSAALRVDVTQWHRYRLEWGAKHTAWYIDDTLVFKSLVSPHPPLGFIVWIDNQYAAFTPEGKIAFGVLEGSAEWLEIENIVISKL